MSDVMLEEPEDEDVPGYRVTWVPLVVQEEIEAEGAGNGGTPPP